MLNNPNWNTNNVSKEKLFNVENLIDWLETKPPERTYIYTDNCGCLLYQYFTENGLDLELVDSINYYLRSEPEVAISYPSFLNSISYGGIYEENTFGAALQRARYYLKNRDR